MSYPESNDTTRRGSFNTSAQRGRGGDRDQFDEFDSAPDRGQFGSSDQPQYRQTFDDFKSQPGGAGYRQQSRDTGFEQQGSDTRFGQQGSDTGFGQQGSDTSGVSQTRRAPGGEGYGYGPSAGGEFDQRETSYAGAHEPATSEHYKGQTAGSEDTGAYGTSGTTQHEPSMMEKIKGGVEKMTGKKGHGGETTEQGHGGGEYGSGEHGQSDEYSQSDTRASKPSMMEKIKAGAEKMSGKSSKDPEHAHAGQSRQEGRQV